VQYCCEFVKKGLFHSFFDKKIKKIFIKTFLVFAISQMRFYAILSPKAENQHANKETFPRKS